MKNNISIFAQALVDNREYKNARINGEAVGVANARKWSATVKAMRIPAYAIRVYRYNHMGDSETVAPCDMTAFFDTLRPVLDLIGEVNGAKLDAQNCAEEILAQALRVSTTDITDEMAHARSELRIAKKALGDFEQGKLSKEEYAQKLAELESAVDEWKEEVASLESQPGNCKKHYGAQSESAFVKAVEMLLGDAIKKQTLKSAEQVAAEEAAKKAEKKARHQAKRAAKKEAQKKTNEANINAEALAVTL